MAFPNPLVDCYQSFSARAQILAIRLRQSRLKRRSDEELMELSRSLQFSVRSGQSLNSALPAAYALIGESIRRVHQMVPYDVQLQAAIYLRKKTIVEMATGEGKTLSVLLPLYLRALQGKGVLLATANDYLAERDGQFAAPVFEKLGMTVAAITDRSSTQDRKLAYACDVTYGTAVQFGFDFLRDRAQRRFAKQRNSLTSADTVGRGQLYAIIVDEADSLLIDEAATPLLLAGAAPELSQEKIEAYSWSARLAPDLKEGTHYRYKKIDKKSELNAVGRDWVHSRLPDTQQSSLSLLDYYKFIERAINVKRDFLLDRNYIIQNQEVLLIDEGTGRIGKGRQWSEGIQQAIQAKENLPLTFPAGHLAKVAVQSLYLSFEHISGFTGTAKQSAAEFRQNYKLGIRAVPTRLRCKWRSLKSTVYPHFDQWLQAIHAECERMQSLGRAVLIGSRSVAQSEMISAYLNAQGVEHQLLNARSDDVEAQIIGQAGQPQRVTVATNMAGRGTDIELHPSVKKSGGLHVILAGIHTSGRIDRQLIGRVARQGDPGSYRKILCLSDDLLDEAFTTSIAESLRIKMRASFSISRCLDLFNRAQRIVSQKKRVDRKSLFYNDKENLKYLHQAGLDPLLDLPG